MNYSSIEEIVAGTDNAETIVNNVAHDDDSVSVNGADWLTFNGVAVSTIYCSGNSWLGFGNNSEDLKVNRRDAKMYYLWREEGTLYGYYRFIRIRWKGYSYYSSTSSTYLTTYDVLLFDNGDIFLHMVDIPTSYNDGTKSLTAGNAYSFTYTADSPDVSFYKQEDGSFVVVNELLQIEVPFARKYMIKDSETGNLYNIADGVLTQIPTNEVTSATFKQYGADEITDTSLLLTIGKPVILYWQDSDTQLPEKRVDVTAIPPEQAILTDIDLSHDSIKGISSVNIDVTGSPTFSVSFDNGDTWSIHNGSEWITLSDGEQGMDADTIKAITSEQWNTAIADISSFVLKILLSSTDDAVNSVVLNFIN